MVTESKHFILRHIPRKESIQLLPRMEFVRLKLHQVLHEPGEVIKSGYFLNNGLGSLLTTHPDGKTVEVGLTGNEGFLGLPVIFGFKSSALRVVTQGEGTAYRIEVDTLLRMLPRCPGLEKQLQRFAMVLGMQSTQLAACNRLHDVVGVWQDGSYEPRPD
jgi:CRP-like cAMP-binding protein